MVSLELEKAANKFCDANYNPRDPEEQIKSLGAYCGYIGGYKAAIAHAVEVLEKEIEVASCEYPIDELGDSTSAAAEWGIRWAIERMKQ